MTVQYQDYYKTLGVERNENAGQIKKSYRSLARKHHPDINPGDKAAEEKFKKIQEAYAVLSDPEKRKRYDQLGPNWKTGANFTPPPGWENVHVQFRSRDDLGDIFSGFGGFSDFFQTVFPGHGPRPHGTRSRRSSSLRGQNIEAKIQLSLEEAHRGTQLTITIPTARLPKSLKININPGTRDGSVLRLAGKGQPGIGKDSAGDLYLRIQIKPHPVFSVIGRDNVQIELPVAPWEAALGTKAHIPTLDGPVQMTIPAKTQNGNRLRLRGLGLKRRNGERGHQYVKIQIVNPPKVSPEEKKLFKELSRISRFNPRAD